MSLSKIKQQSVYFLTLGCAKNEVDTSHMLEKVRQAGYTVVDEPDSAQAIVVNTCSFLQSATEESLETIFDFSRLPQVASGNTFLIVAGCMPARYGSELEKELVEVKSFVPCSKEDDIVEVLNSVLGDAFSNQETGDHFSITSEARFWETPSAYVKISEGCDRFCSYCAIPYIRGGYYSFPASSILSEVDSLIDSGIKEIVLVAQDSGRWGLDLGEGSRLSSLLEMLAERHPSTWFRVMYIQPEGINDELLEVVSRFDNICSYFDIPFQHVNSDLLRAMNRTGSSDEFYSLVSAIREKVPGATLRTTLIAGFPGESEEAFQELCDFVERADFDYVGVFPYSVEEGTAAAALLSQIDEEVKLERAQILRDLADERSIVQVSTHLNQKHQVLVLGREEDGQLFGRTRFQAPDVDGIVYVDRGEVGDIAEYLFVDSLLYDLEGVFCDE